MLKVGSREDSAKAFEKEKTSALYRTCAHINCIKPLKYGRMCEEHMYPCWGCAHRFDPIYYTDLVCKDCLRHSMLSNTCAACKRELDEEGDYKLQGVCDECYNSHTFGACRRCEVTKGYELCPSCVDAHPPCPECGGFKQPDRILCTKC